MSGPVKAQWHFLRTAPKATLELWFKVFLGTLGSTNYRSAVSASSPKVARCADEMVKLGITHIHAHFANHPTVAALAIHRLTGIRFSFTVHAHDLYIDEPTC